MIVTDPWFYVAAVPAVLIYGIGKGGLGGALGIVAVPLMALTIPPVQAAAIMMPILCVMDFFAVREHFHHADRRQLKLMLPGSIIGVTLAGLLMGYASENVLKLLIGSLSLLFCLQYLLNRESKPTRSSGWRGLGRAGFWSLLCGFSSTTIHAGGGPASIYLLPLRLEKVTLIATMAVLFGLINLAKLIPFTVLGKFDTTNMLTALVLIPLAPIGVKLGIWLLHRVSQIWVYRLCYVFLFLSGVKLFADGMISEL
ncbi:sulfite exporter TauE/SafE family protein [Photobacterium ganghwense]|uniref:sulfite exporter TauE/SafE family protein n=1 Tax=Photobacterium ganghwense TaxID=320778 RepID=UPI00405781C5